MELNYSSEQSQVYSARLHKHLREAHVQPLYSLWKNVCVLILGLGNPSSLSQQKWETKERGGVSQALKWSVQPLCKAKQHPRALALVCD